MIWSMEAKVGKCETEMQAKMEVKNKDIFKKIDNTNYTNIHNFITE